ncbi:SoxR reducing system RseC family protein [Propionivibrio soli]|uniref:SoxR reducing system RseC family protein n=1 Tax=Propionivibrio soli TaxID=2976531 RepID=UPI0021E97F1A
MLLSESELHSPPGIDASGTVIAVDGGYATVRVNDVGCGRCHEEGGCGGNNIGRMLCSDSRSFDVLNDAGAEVGEKVTLTVPVGAVRRVAAAAYGIPLMALFAGAGFGMFAAGDGGAIGGAVAGLLVGFVTLRSGVVQRYLQQPGRPYIRH